MPQRWTAASFVFLKMSQFDAAVSDCDAALRINPKRAFALYGRGGEIEERTPPARATSRPPRLQADIAEEYARYGMQEAR